MMAIGDSIYNGVRSLSISGDLAKLSAPAQIAKALRERFIVPQYPKPVIIEAERALRSLPDIASAIPRMQANLKAWIVGPRYSGDVLFDDVSIAGGRVEDIYLLTSRSADDSLKRLLGTFDVDGSLFDMPISSLFFNINARFLLDPTGRPEFAGLSQLAQVALRKPRRLIVNIGANHGLWKLAFEAADLPDDTDGVPATQALGKLFPERMKTLAACLAALPPEIAHVYFNGLIHPSAVANLMPLDKSRRMPGTRYYEIYFNYLGAGYAEVAGTTVQVWDALVDEVNAQVRKTLEDAFRGQPGRLTFVELNPLMDRYDAKHMPEDPDKTVAFRGYALSNWPLEGYPLLPHAGGGLFSADNMHLSTIGYSLLAAHVLGCIGKSESRPVPTSIDLDADYRRSRTPLPLCDTVFPCLREVSWAEQIFRDYRAARAGQAPAAPLSAKDTKFAPVKPVLELLTKTGVLKP